MALSLQQVLKQTQKLIMTPQMQQSIQLLQLNALELEQMIHTEMMENPFLELSDDEEALRTEPKDSAVEADFDPASVVDSGLSDEQKRADSSSLSAVDDEGYDERRAPVTSTDPYEPPPSDDAVATASAPEGEAPPATDFETFGQNDVDWDDQFGDSDTSAYASTREDAEDHDFTTYTAISEGLYESLMRQLKLSVLEGRALEVGEFLVGNLDESGLLDCSLENIARLLGYPPDLVDIKGASNSEDVLRGLLVKLHGSDSAEHNRELNRKQLVAKVVGALIHRTPDECMAMSRKQWLTALIARRLKRPYREVAAEPTTELMLDAVAVRMKTDRETVFEALEVIQDFEPTGVGARDLAECLRLQCEERNIRNRLLYRILDEHLTDLQQKRFREIAKALDTTEAKVQEVFHIVATLDPRPGKNLTKDTPRYIIPDVFVKKVDDKYMYFLHEGDAGKLRIASSYRKMLKGRRAAKFAEQVALEAGDAHLNGTAALEGANGFEAAHGVGAAANGIAMETVEAPPLDDRENPADYAHEKYKNAVWLIKNIEKRKSTVLRVTEAIMNYQKDFLDKGIEHLHPLTLRNIAEVVGMHESTIARVTTQKYVETPRGVFSLKFFFSSGLETDSGEDASSRSIKELITQMIGAENVKRPLSDQKIADMLKDRGIQIARRTVAKYREQLKILPAKLRKQVT